jgi:hypothetical protein
VVGKLRTVLPFTVGIRDSRERVAASGVLRRRTRAAQGRANITGVGVPPPPLDLESGADTREVTALLLRLQSMERQVGLGT